MFEREKYENMGISFWLRYYSSKHDVTHVSRLFPSPRTTAKHITEVDCECGDVKYIPGLLLIILTKANIAKINQLN